VHKRREEEKGREGTRRKERIEEKREEKRREEKRRESFSLSVNVILFLADDKYCTVTRATRHEIPQMTALFLTYISFLLKFLYITKHFI
jgi:hypothetical protein